MFQRRFVQLTAPSHYDISAADVFKIIQTEIRIWRVRRRLLPGRAPVNDLGFMFDHDHIPLRVAPSSDVFTPHPIEGLTRVTSLRAFLGYCWEAINCRTTGTGWSLPVCKFERTVANAT
jgi:hypothetical protein